MDEASARQDCADGVHGDDGRACQLHFQFVRAVVAKRVQISASPPAQARKEISLTGANIGAPGVLCAM